MILRTHRRGRTAAWLFVPTLTSALVASLLIAGTAAVGAPAAVAGPADEQNWKVPRLAVMPLGDSITWGAGSSTGNGYRAELRDRLASHADDLRFVGSLRTNGADHEGHSGWQIGGLSDNIDQWLAAAKPNVVLLNIGTNDMDLNNDVEAAPRRLGHLVDQITTAAPDITVLVSSLVPARNPEGQKRVEKYNAAVPQVVAERRAKGTHVEYIDMGAVTTKDLNDRLHPNDAGYSKMADAFYQGLARAAAGGWIRERVDVKPPRPRETPLGDYKVDINGDGKADYLVVEDDGSVRAWINNGGDGQGGWKDYGRIATGVGAGGGKVRLADIDGDGKADYLVVGENGSVRAFVNNGGDGHGGWKEYGQIATGTGAVSDKVRFADIDGDGKADYLVVEDDGSVRAWINNGGDGHGGWKDYGRIDGGAAVPADKVRFADIDGDGKADYLVVGENGSVRAFVNNGGDGHGGWKEYGQIATGTGAVSDKVRFADIDGDGKADYLVVEDDGSVHAWINNGGDGHGGWADHGRIASGAGPGYRVRI
ncbi:FG-GAP-like repeat-containing protein [Streptomyces sp. NPDC051173]|uniref:FG-GAP-like repeat-containing protein n=1 Tax=Streptomyces sp. NPDC051173 TaxID=3155164 RepID=UPI00344CD40D